MTQQIYGWTKIDGVDWCGKIFVKKDEDYEPKRGETITLERMGGKKTERIVTCLHSTKKYYSGTQYIVYLSTKENWERVLEWEKKNKKS